MPAFAFWKSKEASNPAETPLKDNGSIRDWVIPVMSGVILVVATIFVLRPWFDDIMNKRDLVQGKKRQIEKLSPKLDVLSSQDAEELKDYLVQLELFIPGQVGPPFILATLEQAVNEANLQIDAVQFRGLSDLASKEAAEQNADENAEPTLENGKIDVQLTVNGEYYQIVEFLKTIENTSPLVLGVELNVDEAGSSRLVETQENIEQVISRQLSFVGAAPFQDLPENLGSLTVDVTELSQSDLDLINELKTFRSLLSVGNSDNNQPSVQYPKGKGDPF